MKLLHYEKVSDVNFDYCFLEIFKDKDKNPFMDARISEEQKLSFCIYSHSSEVSLTVEEWREIYDMSESFLKQEIDNEDSFKKL